MFFWHNFFRCCLHQVEHSEVFTTLKNIRTPSPVFCVTERSPNWCLDFFPYWRLGKACQEASLLPHQYFWLCVQNWRLSSRYIVSDCLQKLFFPFSFLTKILRVCLCRAMLLCADDVYCVKARFHQTSRQEDNSFSDCLTCTKHYRDFLFILALTL